MKNCPTLTTVSDVVSLIPGFCDDGLAVVKPHQEDGDLDTGSVSEDSDCESGLEQAGESTPADQVDGREESEREPLPVLTIGSFAGCAQHSVAV